MAPPVGGPPRRQKKAHLVLIDESGILLSPLVRRTLAPRGQTPILKTVGRKRQKVSLVAALSVSPRRRRLGLYFRTYRHQHLTHRAVADFLRQLLRHLRGPVLLLWDNGNTHKGPALRQLQARYRRVSIAWFFG